MVGMTPDGTGVVGSAIARSYVGSVYYTGGWTGGSTVRAASARLQGQARGAGSPGMLIAADQEGGQVQQLTGDGFPAIDSALTQARRTPAARTAYAHVFATRLAAAGLNLDLAPVADTVPTSVGARNAPIGAFARQYGSQPGAVAAAVGDVVRGIRSARVATTVKHFPGLGRITGTTDVTASGIEDPITTATDPYLGPFRAGISAGTQAVMVSSARYPKLDPRHPAVFSPAVINGLLRGRLRFGGVVITDDVHAAALASTPVGSRAVQFVAAGGDIVLTAATALVPQLASALVARSASDPAFSTTMQAAVRRVLTMKARLGLLRC